MNIILLGARDFTQLFSVCIIMNNIKTAEYQNTIICDLKSHQNFLGKQGFGPGDQEWGFVTVRPKAYMFWWLYYTTADIDSKYEKKPLIIWLQGGPGGASSGIGNFQEIGLLDINLRKRNHSWVCIQI